MTNNFPGQPPIGHGGQPYPQSQTALPTTITTSTGTVLTTVVQLPAATTLTQTAISITSTGDTTVYATSTGTTIKVYRMLLWSTGSSTVTVKSGAATSLSGGIPISTTAPVLLEFDPYPYFVTTNSTDALVVNVSTAAGISGVVSVVRS